MPFSLTGFWVWWVLLFWGIWTWVFDFYAAFCLSLPVPFSHVEWYIIIFSSGFWRTFVFLWVVIIFFQVLSRWCQWFCSFVWLISVTRVWIITSFISYLSFFFYILLLISSFFFFLIIKGSIFLKFRGFLGWIWIEAK